MFFSPLLFSYIASEIFYPFIAAFFITNGILILGQMIPLFQLIIDLGLSVPNLIRLIAFMAPRMLIFSLPLASMLGIVLGVSRLASEGDIQTLKACGISLYRLLPPIIVFALLNSILTGYCAAEIMPYGQLAMRRLLFEMAKEKFDKNIRPRTFSEGTGKIVFYINEIDAATKNWRGVYISDLRNAEKPVFLLAKQAHISAESKTLVIRLELTDGSIHMADTNGTQTVGFKRYHFTLPLDPPQEVAGERASVIGRNAMRLGALTDEARKYGEKTVEGLNYLIEFHTRLLIPVGGFFLSIMALPLGMLARPGRRAMGIPLALGVYIFYYLFVSVAKTIVEQANMPVWLSMWSVNILIAVATIMFVRMSARETIFPVMERIENALHALRARS